MLLERWVAEEWIRPVHTVQVEDVAGTIGCLFRNLPQPLNYVCIVSAIFNIYFPIYLLRDVFHRDFPGVLSYFQV